MQNENPYTINRANPCCNYCPIGKVYTANMCLEQEKTSSMIDLPSFYACKCRKYLNKTKCSIAHLGAYTGSWSLASFRGHVSTVNVMQQYMLFVLCIKITYVSFIAWCRNTIPATNYFRLEFTNLILLKINLSENI